MECNRLEIGEWTVDKSSKRLIRAERNLSINMITDLHLSELELP